MLGRVGGHQEPGEQDEVWDCWAGEKDIEDPGGPAEMWRYWSGEKDIKSLGET